MLAAACSGGPGGQEAATTTTTTAPPPLRDASAYEGLGAWVDVFDYAPAYQEPATAPTVTPDSMEVLAVYGVRTLFLQAARLDSRSPDGIVDDALVGEILARARSQGMRVVGWYLPKFADIEADLARLEMIREFEHDGHRFDGVAVDIEWRRDVPDDDERNARLVELSQRLREQVGTEAVGAIVPPPVLLEVVNQRNWPDFPWPELAGLYDVWLPMSYWTLRTSASGYRDGYRYTDENVRRLRANLGDPDALVHPIGGIADEATDDSYRGFVRAAEEMGAVGLSVYDYATTGGAGWSILRRSTGPPEGG
jgi:hypothetical protein